MWCIEDYTEQTKHSSDHKWFVVPAAAIMCTGSPLWTLAHWHKSHEPTVYRLNDLMLDLYSKKEMLLLKVFCHLLGKTDKRFSHVSTLCLFVYSNPST